MITVSHQPKTDLGQRAFSMTGTKVAEPFVRGMLPHLSAAYDRYFSDCNFDVKGEKVDSIVAMTIEPGAAHSWKWRFVCNRTSKSAPLLVLGLFLIDGPAERSTLMRDMPLTVPHLPAPIDIDGKTTELVKKTLEHNLPA